MHNLNRNGLVFAVWAVIFCLLAGLLAPVMTASAAGGTLTLVCKAEDVILSGMNWKLYKAANQEADGSFSLCDPFAAYPVSLEDQDVSAMQNAADTLENYAVLKNLSERAVGTTDANGILSFSDLEKGLYLIVGSPVVLNNATCYIPSAALVEVKEEFGMVVDLVTYPKFTIRPVRTDSDESFTVRKIWQNDENTATSRPASIQVEIYRNSKLYETRELNEANAWSYTWAGNPNDDWRILEKEVPKSYTVIYKRNATQFVAVNTGSETVSATTTQTTQISTDVTTIQSVVVTVAVVVTDTPPSGGGTTTGKLPQTGQLWWPVPIFGTVGLLLFAFGWRLCAKNKKEDIT